MLPALCSRLAANTVRQTPAQATLTPLLPERGAVIPQKDPSQAALHVAQHSHPTTPYSEAKLPVAQKGYSHPTRKRKSSLSRKTDSSFPTQHMVTLCTQQTHSLRPEGTRSEANKATHQNSALIEVVIPIIVCFLPVRQEGGVVPKREHIPREDKSLPQKQYRYRQRSQHVLALSLFLCQSSLIVQAFQAQIYQDIEGTKNTHNTNTPKERKAHVSFLSFLPCNSQGVCH